MAGHDRGRNLRQWYCGGCDHSIDKSNNRNATAAFLNNALAEERCLYVRTEREIGAHWRTSFALLSIANTNET